MTSPSGRPYHFGEIQELKQRIEAKATEARALESLATELNSEEHFQKLADLLDEIRGLQARQQVMEAKNSEHSKALAALPSDASWSFNPNSKNGVIDLEKGRYGGSQASPFINAGTGRPVPVLGPADRLGDGSFSVGDYLYGALTGDIQPSAIGADASFGGSDPQGGYLLNPALSRNVIDLARAASVAVKAGAQTLPMETGELAIARLTGDPTAVWRAETVRVNSSAPSFDKVVLRAKTLAAICPVSIELLEDAANARSVIESSLQSALALSLDQAVLSGSGAGSTPLGILSTTGVNDVNSVGTPADFSDVSEAIGDILSANYNGAVSDLAWVANPRDGLTYDGLQDTTNQPMQPTKWVGMLRGPYYTTSLAVNGGATSMIVGDFSQVVIGMRTNGVVVRILDAGEVTDSAGTTWNAASQLMRLIVCYLRADVAVLRPSWLTKLTGVTAT